MRSESLMYVFLELLRLWRDPVVAPPLLADEEREGVAYRQGGSGASSP